ncbi:hypothetical protein D3C85_1451540 [compost metagenome]
MNNISFNELPKQLSRLLHRYHVVTFTLVVLGGMAVAIFLLNNILQASSQPGEGSGISSSFDTDTINRVNELKSSTDAPETMSFPTGRINPFVE